VQAELSGDYSEAFNYESSQPDLALLSMQRKVAERFREIAGEASSPTEKERLGYFSGFVGLMVPYCDALELAHEVGGILTEATKLRADSKEDDARELVLSKGVPLWLTMAPLVRQTMLTYQNIVSTRNDQGQLASMQNKFVRISLERLRLSIKEFLGELPAEVNQAYESAITAKSACSTRFESLLWSLARRPRQTSSCTSGARGGTSGRVKQQNWPAVTFMKHAWVHLRRKPRSPNTMCQRQLWGKGRRIWHRLKHLNTYTGSA
jgi:hypothetical protein